MIKGINTGGRYMQVDGGSPSTTYINNYGGNPGVGNMRYNPSNNNIEVYDGNSWQQLMMSYATVKLNYDAESLLDWARVQRDHQMKRQELIDKNPALAKAYEAIKRAEENFDILSKFVEHDKQSEAESVQSSP